MVVIQVHVDEWIVEVQEGERFQDMLKQQHDAPPDGKVARSAGLISIANRLSMIKAATVFSSQVWSVLAMQPQLFGILVAFWSMEAPTLMNIAESTDAVARRLLTSRKI